MIEVTGDLWTYDAQVRGVTTNGVVSRGKAVMGGGCALEAAQRYPLMPLLLADHLILTGNTCGVFEFLDGTILLTFPTKEHYKDPSPPGLIIQSAKDAVEIADRAKWESIVLPRPGCGLGGLDWEEVRDWVGPILDDRFHLITFA